MIENEIATKTYPLGLDQQALEVQVSALQEHLADLVVQVPYTGFQILQEPSAETVSKVAPHSPTNSRLVRAAVGLAIGLVVGALAALGLWLLDRRLKTAKRAMVAFGYPVVAEIPPYASDATEPYRMLWLSVFREPCHCRRRNRTSGCTRGRTRCWTGCGEHLGSGGLVVTDNLPYRHAAGLTPARHAARSVVMITSPGPEPSLGDVALRLATICSEVGQRVALVSTAGLGEPEEADLPRTTPLWWKNWPSPGRDDTFSAEPANPLLSGPLNPGDVEDLLGATSVSGVFRLDVRYFVGHPVQVVIRMPDVLAALRQIVDVVILEVPSYLSVHHGEGLDPDGRRGARGGRAGDDDHRRGAKDQRDAEAPGGTGRRYGPDRRPATGELHLGLRFGTRGGGRGCRTGRDRTAPRRRAG